MHLTDPLVLFPPPSTRVHRHLAEEDRRVFYRSTVRATFTDRAPSVTQFFRVRRGDRAEEYWG